MFEPGSLFYFYSFIFRPQVLALIYLLVISIVIFVLSRRTKTKAALSIRILFISLIVPQFLEITIIATYSAYRFQWKLMSTQAMDIVLAISPYFQFYLIQIFEYALLASVVTYVALAKISWKELGLRMPTIKALKTIGFVAGAFIVFMIALFIIEKVPILVERESKIQAATLDNMIIHIRSASTILDIAYVISVIVVAPFIEELFYRGLIFTSIEKVSGPLIALILQAALFSVMHEQPLYYVRFFIFGLITGYLFYKSKSILPGVIFHGAINMMADSTLKCNFN